MTRRTSLLPALAILLVPLPLAAARPVDAVRQDALFRDARSHLVARAFELGLDRAHEDGTEVLRVHQTYRGESGGLNESMSDIFGTMAEFYGNSSGSTIPSTGGNWTIGEQLRGTPLRCTSRAWTVPVRTPGPLPSSGSMPTTAPGP